MKQKPNQILNTPVARGRLRGARHADLLNILSPVNLNGLMSDVRVGKQTIKPTPAITSKIIPNFDKEQNMDFKVSKHSHSTLGKIDGIQARTPNPRPDVPKQKKSNVLKRQMLKVPPYTSPRKHRPPLIPTMISGLAIMLFAAGVIVLVNALRSNHTVKAQVRPLSQKTEIENGISEGTPSEVSPTSAADYKVSADLPRLITIDKINVSALIKKVGVGPNNIVNAPANIFDVGWYDGSAKPGENGAIVLDGHVSGPTKHGVFYSLGTLKSGDKLSIERGDGQKFNYTVTETQIIDNDKVDITKIATSSSPGKPSLNLMTCAGRFNVRSNQFEQRIIVFSVQD